MGSILVFFGLPFFLPRLPQNWFIFFIIFGSNFGSLFWGLGVLWVSFGSLLGPLDSLLGGPKSEKMPTVQRENHFCENAVFWLFEALDGELLEPILGPILGPDRPKRGQDEPKRTEKLTAKC